MKEVKSPKKPLIYYYVIVLVVLLLFQLIMIPLLNSQSVVEVDYGTFMSWMIPSATCTSAFKTVRISAGIRCSPK